MKSSITHTLGWMLPSLLSAFLLIMTFPEPGISPLGWFALAPLLYVILRYPLKRTILAGLITGVVFNFLYIIWMKEYKNPATLSGGILNEIIFFMAAVLLSRYLALNPPRRGWFSTRFLRTTVSADPRGYGLEVPLLALGWLVIDYLKTVGFLAFPWGILAYSQYRNLRLIQSASLFGIWGLNYAMLYTNGVAALLLLRMMSKKRTSHPVPWAHLIVAACLIVLSLTLGDVVLRRGEGAFDRHVRVALVQPNFDPWNPRVADNLATEFALTQQALTADPDLVVWSESSVPFYYPYYLKRGHRYALAVQEYIRSTGTPFLFGTIDFEGEMIGGRMNGDFYNIAVYYDGSGNYRGEYRKIHLVPFGEWFPYGRIFPFVKSILERAGAGDFTPGEEYSLFHIGETTFNVLICFEDVFGDLARRFVREGSELFVNVTNDAWTGSEKAEIQHYAKSVFRAVENRRSLVRAANGGVTACIDPYGRRMDSLPLFTTDYLVCDVPVIDSARMTVYTRLGDFLPKGAGVLSILLVLFVTVKKVVDRRERGNKMVK
jgi:apolipoprotein N-acyltransferase